MSNGEEDEDVFGDPNEMNIEATSDGIEKYDDGVSDAEDEDDGTDDNVCLDVEVEEDDDDVAPKADTDKVELLETPVSNDLSADAVFVIVDVVVPDQIVTVIVSLAAMVTAVLGAILEAIPATTAAIPVRCVLEVTTLDVGLVVLLVA